MDQYAQFSGVATKRTALEQFTVQTREHFYQATTVQKKREGTFALPSGSLNGIFMVVP